MKKQKIKIATLVLVLALIISSCDPAVDKKDNKINSMGRDVIPSVEDIKKNDESDLATIKSQVPTIAPSLSPKPQKMKEPIKNISSDIPKNLGVSKQSWYVIRNTKQQLPEVQGNIKNMLKKYNAYYYIQSDVKKVYLTFDEGYENGYTASILETLKNKNVKASFFIMGQYLKTQKKLVERMITEGHSVENHTMNHPSMPSLDEKRLKAEVEELHKMVKEAFGVEMKYIRPPMGEYNEKVLYMLNSLGYKTAFWGFAYDDFDINNQKGREYAHKMIMDNLHSGEIMLLHAVSKDNAEVLPQIIDEIQEKGYKIGKLE